MFPLPWRQSMLIVVRTCDGMTHGSGIALASIALASPKLSANRFRMRGFSTDSICGAISGIYTRPSETQRPKFCFLPFYEEVPIPGTVPVMNWSLS